MSRVKEYRFQSCRINLGTRQVFVSDQLRATRPRVFDLLVYLVENRDRVVTKEEIIDYFWGNQTLTGNAVEVAILLARGAIGDRQAGASLIKTVHRVGYRFTGILEEDVRIPDTARTSPPRTDTSSRAPENAPRLVLLPFQNATGDPKLKWIELGLPSLVSNAVAVRARIIVVPLSGTLSALEHIEERQPESSRARSVAQALGADCVVAVTVGSSDSAFSLTYCCYADGGIQLRGVVRGPELTQLGLQLALDIEGHLNPSGPEGQGPVVSDRFASECFARAMQASREEKFRSAARLFRIYLDIEPDSVEGRISYIRALSEIGDPRALELARELLDNARRLEDLQLEAMAHYAESVGYFLVDRDYDAADASIDRALALVAESCNEDWYSHALTHKAQVHFVRGEFEAALHAYARATRAAERIGHRLRLSGILNNVGAIEYFRGNLLRARELFIELAELSHNSRSTHQEAGALINQGSVNASLGLFEQSIRAIERGAAILREVKEPPKRYAVAAVYVVGILAEMRQVEACRRLAQDFERSFWSDGTSLDVACREFGLGHAERSRANLRGALEHMHGAVELILDPKYFKALEQFVPFLAHLEARLGEGGALEKTREMIRSHTGFERSPTLQGELAHAAALQARLNGHDDLAQACLEEAVGKIRTGLFLGYSCMDLAWMLLEQGERTRAESIVRGVEPWLQQHPAGLVVGANLQFHRGDYAGAHELHERHLRLVGGQAGTVFARMGKVYAAAAHGDPVPHVPPIRALPTGYQVFEEHPSVDA